MNHFFDREIATNQAYDVGGATQNDFMKMTQYMNSSKAFGGFSEDKLGRLAEDNKMQMHKAMRQMNGNFRRTDQDFHGKPLTDKSNKIQIRKSGKPTSNNPLHLQKSKDSYRQLNSEDYARNTNQKHPFLNNRSNDGHEYNMLKGEKLVERESKAAPKRNPKDIFLNKNSEVQNDYKEDNKNRPSTNQQKKVSISKEVISQQIPGPIKSNNLPAAILKSNETF